MIEWWFGPGVKTIFTWLCFLQKRHRSQSSLLPAAESSRYFHVPIWMLVDGVQGSGSTATRFNTSHFIVQTPITIMIFSRNLTGNRHDVNSSSLPIWSAPVNIKQSIILSLSFSRSTKNFYRYILMLCMEAWLMKGSFLRTSDAHKLPVQIFHGSGCLGDYYVVMNSIFTRRVGKMEKGKKKRKNEKAKERGKNKSKELMKTF